MFSLPAAATAQSLIPNTELADVSLGTGLSAMVQDESFGGYALSDGTYQSFEGWYSSDWKDLGIEWQTDLTPTFGLRWGMSTGEKGEKYQIEPSLTLGFVMTSVLSRNETLTFSASTRVGGNLTEETCIADYGEIGGVQTVNCRLAATPLPPSDTLQYLFNSAPPDRAELKLQYSFEF